MLRILQNKMTIGCLVFLEFAIAFLFGMIGHFFSLLCFPILALLRGILTTVGVKTGSKRLPKKYLNKLFSSGFVGGIIFFLGLILGTFTLVIVRAPNVTNNLGNESATILGSAAAIIEAVLSVLVFDAFYAVVYFWFVVLGGYLGKNL